MGIRAVVIISIISRVINGWKVNFSTLINKLTNNLCLLNNFPSILRISSITPNLPILKYNICPVLHNYQRPTKIYNTTKISIYLLFQLMLRPNNLKSLLNLNKTSRMMANPLWKNHRKKRHTKKFPFSNIPRKMLNLTLSIKSFLFSVSELRVSQFWRKYWIAIRKRYKTFTKF